MENLTSKEKEILLVLLKDFSTNYNSRSIIKKVAITHPGAFKAMNRLAKNELVVGKRMGHAVFYKVNLNDYCAFRIMEVLLISEAKEKAGRWLYEFKDILAHAEAAVIFGSILRNPQKANDIDILLVFKREKNRIIDKLLEEKRTVSLKAIHINKQTPEDLMKNLINGDEVILSALRTGYVLQGYEMLLKLIKDVTGKQ